ncbi:TonB-dependent siderophore receptor [Bordetella genomosp. 1]|uniref:TonB-dependent siderophore receptor n=1 Tax=Bordetella genomosp. 1 TaxID=1395607 RepID=A0ABX4F0D2_9BORD|nr:TonB-dependent siderophore receptor [Bordetella genomosp. 1]
MSLSSPSRPLAARPARTALASALTAAFAAGLAAPAQAQTDVSQLPAVTVNAAPLTEETLVKLNTPVNSGALGSRTQLETPFSSTVIGNVQLEDSNPSKLGDVFFTDASVSDNSAAYGAWASYLTVRGLPLDWQNSYRIDGNPFLSYVTTLPYEQFDQIELRKGATGFMYGFGSPGGLINYVTKKPTDVPVRSIDLGYTSKGILRQHADIGGRVGETGAFGYRLNATHEEGNTYNGGSIYRNAFSLALDARLSERLTWDFQSIYQDRKATDIEPTITVSGLDGDRLPSPVRNDNGRLVGGGSYADNDFRYYATGLKYQFNDDWSARATYSYSTTKTRRNESVLSLLDRAGNYDNYRSDYGEGYGFNHWSGMVQGKFATGALAHEVVFGASWQKQKNDYSNDGFYGLVGSGNLGRQNPHDYYSQGQLHLYRAAEITQKAVFASDTIDLTHGWSFLGGARITDYQQRSLNNDGSTNPGYRKNGVVTPTLALMYKITPRTMAYGSYIESLEQGTSVGINYSNYGELTKPLKSRQYELGIKTDQDGWAATAALFRIERKAEFGQPDAAGGLPTWVQDGKSIYQGLELAASTRLGANWNVGGSLMLLDSEYKRSAANEGNRVAGAPKFIAAAQLAYSVPQVQGLRLRADVKYTGATMVDADNDVQADGYALVNIGATYDTRIAGYDTTWRAGINNLFDKKYWLYQSADYVKAGDPRVYMVSATVRF